MLNVIDPGAAFAALIASRKEQLLPDKHVPSVSSVLVTTYGPAAAARCAWGAKAISSASSPSRLSRRNESDTWPLLHSLCRRRLSWNTRPARWRAPPPRLGALRVRCDM